MRYLYSISFFLLLGMVSCSSPPREEIGLLTIRCVGLPALPSWVQDHVADEAGGQTGCRIRLLPLLRVGTMDHGCLRPVCMRHAGRVAQVDWVLGGSIERLADRVLIGWRMINMHDDEQDWFAVQDQPYHPDRLEIMIRASLRDFLQTVQNDVPAHPGQKNAKSLQIEWLDGSGK